MKGLYVSTLNPSVSAGYGAKFEGQLRAFESSGIPMDVISFDGTGGVVWHSAAGGDKLPMGNTDSAGVVARRRHFFRAAGEVVDRSLPSFLYIRYPFSDAAFISFLRKQSRQHPDLTIACELPTFPYEKEFLRNKTCRSFVQFAVDRCFRIFLRYSIDVFYVIALGTRNSVFGVRAVGIDNGVSVEKTPLRETIRDREETDVVRILGVGNVNFWHGYDRVVSGIAAYRSSGGVRELRFDIVGPESSCLSALRAQVRDDRLEDTVFFHGAHYGDALTSFFDEADIGIGSLAVHRHDIQSVSALKHREFCARGLPFLCSSSDADFQESLGFVMPIDDSDTPIDINKLINFRDCTIKEERCRERMRRFAEQRLDWSVKMKPAVDDLRQIVASRQQERRA